MQSRFAKKVDGNQAEIVKHLRACFLQCVVTNMGNDFPDLLVGHGDDWILLEVKVKSGDLTRGQLSFIANAEGPVAVVTDKQEARDAVVNRWTRIDGEQKDRIAGWLLRNPEQETLRVTKFRKIIDG